MYFSLLHKENLIPRHKQQGRASYDIFQVFPLNQKLFLTASPYVIYPEINPHNLMLLCPHPEKTTEQ